MLQLIFVLLQLYLIKMFLCSEINTNTDVFTHQNWPRDVMKICGNVKTNKIVNGHNANLGQFPWFAILYYKNDPTIGCGGVLISIQYVLTVAHCSGNETPMVTIVLGEHNLLTKIDCEDNYCADPPQIYKPAKIISYKGYTRKLNVNDIAIVKLDRKVKITEWVLPICLPYGSILTKDLYELSGETAGFGFTNITLEKSPYILQMSKLTIHNDDVCLNNFSAIFHYTAKSMLCASGKGTVCKGDSGSALMKVFNSKHGPRYFLLGLVSFGRKNCPLNDPRAFTDVRYYMNWILERMNL